MTGRPIEHEKAVALLREVYEGRPQNVPAWRREEAQAIVDYWPWVLIEDWASRTDGAWHGLLEPSRWHDVDPALVHAFVVDFVGRKARWPSVDAIRRLGGRVTNHRRPGDTEGQERLSV